MYFRRSTDLTRSLFDIEQNSAQKLFFFVVMLLAGLINIRLAALLPWKQTQRRAVLVRLQQLYLVGKCLEDLPQLAIAATYLAARGASGELSGSAVGTAVLNMVISGASFLLTLLWLGLQAADSSKHRASRRAPSTKKLPRSSGLEQVKINLDLPTTVTEEAEHAEDAAGSGDVYPSPPKTRPTDDEPSDPGSRNSSISSRQGSSSRSRRPTLDHGADLVELAQLVVVQRGDHQPAASVMLDDALGLQPPQRLADRGAGDAEALGQLRLHQPGAGRITAAVDGVEDQGIGVGRAIAGHGSGLR